MSLFCPQKSCFRTSSPKIVRKGRFYRSSDHQKIQRFLCLHCKKSFSQATGHPCWGQKKRHVNELLKQLLCSGVSMRRAARILRIHRITVARKLEFLGKESLHKSSESMVQFGPIREIQFDELETFEHTQCKPLSVVMAVLPRTRKIVGFEVASMPSKGPLASISRKRYGFRRDQRSHALSSLLKSLKPHVLNPVTFISDSNPHYPSQIQRFFPTAQHIKVFGRRGCVTGPGELKSGGFDPLFSLNHTFAMLRANINRLIRRTWCTTKKPEALKNHLALYVDYHNSVLT